MTPHAAPWWRDAVVYQIYLRSFSDSDGDGVGDLAGIAGKMGYLAALGVDAIWLNPCYPSPNKDGGYDVADYTGIDPAYGDLATFDTLVETAHGHGLRVLMDLVPNHCSDAHPWFQQALAAGPGSSERARFHFRDVRGAGGDEPPTDRRAGFGGAAWTRVTDQDGRPEQWYLHSFDPGQPDFNWANGQVREFFDSVLRTWFDRGVDGFRIDVANNIVKNPDAPEQPGPDPDQDARNQQGLVEIFARWRAVADEYQRDAPLVGETWVAPATAAEYIRPARLTQVFCFDLTLKPWNAEAFRTAIDDVLTHLPAGGGGPAWTLNNHDIHRAVSRYGLIVAEPLPGSDDYTRSARPRGLVDVDLGITRARAAALMLLALPGSAYLYQGEELGLPEVMDLPDSARRDPLWFRAGGTDYGRDGCRVPLPWNDHAPNFGFTDGSAPPWLPQPDWFGDFAASTQDGVAGSTLTHYRAAIALRRKLFTDDDVAWLDSERSDVLAFRRGSAISVTNMGIRSFAIPEEWGELALRSDDSHGRTLVPGTGAWLSTGR